MAIAVILVRGGETHAKMHYFSIFFKNLTTHALIFRGFGRKTLLGSFEKSLKIFNEDSIEKLNFQLFLEKELLVQQKFKKILDR